MLSSKIAAYFLYKLSKKKAPSIFMMLGACIFLIILIPVAIFSPGDSGYTDPYEEAWQNIDCSSDNEFITADIRGYESYVDPTLYNNISKEEAQNRMSEIYLHVSSEGQEKVCLLKSDKEIIEILKEKYTLTREQEEDLLINIYSIRNGRQNFILPVAEAVQSEGYDEEKGKHGLILKGAEHAEAVALADGVITNIETISTKLPYKNKPVQGLTVTIKYEVQGALNEDGEYDMKTMYSEYSLISDVTLNVGESVKQGDRIGRLKESNLYLTLKKANGDYVNPNYYIYLEKLTEGLVLPFELPIPITSRVGGRELGGADYHYGLDMDKAQDSEIHVLASGEVVLMNSTCAPYGGKLGSMCPRPNPVMGGGNYVMVEFEYEDEIYYATYMHMAKVDVKIGDMVNAGDVIGTQGHSGNSTASHLHLEIHKGTKRVGVKEGLIDPEEFLDFTGEE